MPFNPRNPLPTPRHPHATLPPPNSRHAPPQPLQGPQHRQAERVRDLCRSHSGADAAGGLRIWRGGVAVSRPRVGRVSDPAKRAGSGRDPVRHLACERLHDGGEASGPGCPSRVTQGALAATAAGVVRVAAGAGSMRAAVRRRRVGGERRAPCAGGRLRQRRAAQPPHDPALAVTAALGAAAAGRCHEGGGSTGPARFTSR